MKKVGGSRCGVGGLVGLVGTGYVAEFLGRNGNCRRKSVLSIQSGKNWLF